MNNFRQNVIKDCMRKILALNVRIHKRCSSERGYEYWEGFRELYLKALAGPRVIDSKLQKRDSIQMEGRA